MKKIVGFMFGALLSVGAFANPDAPHCYALSKDAKTFSPNGEKLCVAVINEAKSEHSLVLKAGLGEEERTVATFDFVLLAHTQTPISDKKHFGVKVKSAADKTPDMFQRLDIVFEGNRDAATGEEHGIVRVGGVRLTYKSIPQN
jgi:hypothetical protein